MESQVDKAKHAGRLAQLVPQPRENDVTIAAPAVLVPAVTSGLTSIFRDGGVLA
jgi:hypothetical protein